MLDVPQSAKFITPEHRHAAAILAREYGAQWGCEGLWRAVGCSPANAELLREGGSCPKVTVLRMLLLAKSGLSPQRAEAARLDQSERVGFL